MTILGAMRREDDHASRRCALRKEPREDVVRMARSREDGVTTGQVAEDFGVHEMTLTEWMRRADMDVGVLEVGNPQKHLHSVRIVTGRGGGVMDGGGHGGSRSS
jgi:transposase-like protein